MNKDDIKKRIREIDFTLSTLGRIKEDTLAIKGMRKELSVSEKTLDDLAGRRNELVTGFCKDVESGLNRFFDGGNAVFRVVDDSVFIGIKRGDSLIPYRGLSGGEKVAFDAALCCTLGDGSIVIIEAAEVDSKNLLGLMSALSNSETKSQIIINSCNKPDGEIPSAWNVVEL